MASLLCRTEGKAINGAGLGSPGIPEILRSVGAGVKLPQQFRPYYGMITATSRDRTAK